MICEKIDRYIRDVLCSDKPSVSLALCEQHAALRSEVAKLAGHIFERQFLQPETAKNGGIRLSSCGRCPRQIAYGFHKFPKAGKEIDQRSKVVFFMGDLTELLLVALARVAGCQIENYGLQQKTVAVDVGGARIEGHPDGFLLSDGQPLLLEVKSMPSYSYERFERGEIDDSYKAQIQGYLEATNLELCCMVALNKDSGVISEIVVKRDPAAWLAIKARLLSVVKSTPESLPQRPYAPDAKGFLVWNCRYCSFRKTCWPAAQEVLAGRSYKLKLTQQ